MRNPDKKRFLDAISHKFTGEVPLVEADPDIEIANTILGSDFPLSLHSYELQVPDYVELNRRMGNDLIYFADIWRLGRKEFIDADGRIHYVDGTMKTKESLSEVSLPDLDDVRRRLEETLAAIDGTGFGLLCSNKHSPAVVSTAVGITDYWLGVMETPEFIQEFQKIIHEHCMRELELFAEYGVEAINIGLNVGMKSGPICSKSILEEFHLPFLREQVSYAKEHGVAVRVHADGSVSWLIPYLVEMGADIIHPLEPCDGEQDIYEIKNRFGSDIALHGNIDVAGVLRSGSPEDVRADVLEHLEKLSMDGGYIVGSSHDLPAGMPVENFYAMRDAVVEWRGNANG